MKDKQNKNIISSDSKNPLVIVSFSGGKDSTWMLLEMIKRKEHIDSVVFFDTGWEFPQMIRHVEKIKQIVIEHGIDFVTLHPSRSFDYLMFEKPHRNKEQHGWSWCGYGGGRWGTREKINTINKYFDGIDNHIQCLGIAADETKRIEKERKANIRLPLVEYGITEKECLEGCYNLGYDWEGLYEYLDRVSCKFCAYKNLKELRNIYCYMPDVWEELKDYQSRTHLPYKGKQGSVFDLEKRFELEKEFKKHGENIRSKKFYETLHELI